MKELLIIMLERVGTIIAVAFILTRFSFFKNLIAYDKLNKKQEFTAILFFGFFGIIGTYLGVALHTSSLDYNSVTNNLVQDEAIANMRVIGVAMAGLLGGYRIGLGAGLIAGIHRMTLGGFTAFSCGASTILAGLIAGLLHKKGKPLKPLYVFFVGASLEAFQMLLILGISRPIEKSVALVEIIGVPMVIANGLGAVIFLLIVQSVISDREKVIAQQAEKTLRIADQTLKHLRQGINEKTAQTVCRILYQEMTPCAVAITDTKAILAHIGEGNDHHQQQSAIQTAETLEAVESGKIMIQNKYHIHCKNENCPLKVAIIAPLKQRNKVVGVLKLYFSSEKDMTDSDIEVVTGLTKLFNNQLELAEAEDARTLANEAEIKVLQTQIQPHFLFNAMNIIMSLIRTNPDEARRLLHSLSYSLRHHVTNTNKQFTTLKEELEHAKAYLTIMEARFIDRLTIHYDIDSTILKYHVPAFTLQPLIENAIQHGLKDQASNCELSIKLKDQQENVFIEVKDNGRGIERAKLKQLGQGAVASESGTGIGLYNVNRRLFMHYGPAAQLNIESQLAQGTRIYFEIDKVGMKAS